MLMMLLLSPPQSYPHSVPFLGKRQRFPFSLAAYPSALRTVTATSLHSPFSPRTIYRIYIPPNPTNPTAHHSHALLIFASPPSSTLDQNPPQQPNDTQPCNHNSTDAFHVSAESPQWARTHHRTMNSQDGFEARLCYHHATRDADPSLAVLANSVGR